MYSHCQCCSVTMQIDRRINSTTDQREEERKVKNVGHPFAAAGIGFRSVPLTAVCSRIGWMRHYVAIVWHRKGKKKSKGSFYIAQYPVGWTAQSALHFLPPLADLFIPTPTQLLREAF